jgi:histidine triad (HIT) family protein
MSSDERGIGNCIFCQIVNGTSPVSLVYEDDLVLVFPDIQPINPGHLLIIPKDHAPYLNDQAPEILGHILKVAAKVASAIRRSKIKCEGINIFVADGQAAGQEVFHFHLHVYPRFNGDGFGFKYDKSRHFIRIDRAELDRIAREIRWQVEHKPATP